VHKFAFTAEILTKVAGGYFFVHLLVRVRTGPVLGSEPLQPDTAVAWSQYMLWTGLSPCAAIL